MPFLLDTDSCIALLNRRSPSLRDRLLAHPASEFAISAITAAELVFGAEKSAKREENLARVATLRSEIRTEPFDEISIATCGAVRADLERRGVPIGPLDTLIAAHALALEAVLVTSNLREFRRVRGLRCEDWSRSR